MITQLSRISVCLVLSGTLFGSIALAQSRGTAEDESAIRAAIQGPPSASKAERYATDADWTNAFGVRIQSREELAKFFDKLSRSANFQAASTVPGSRKIDVRFVRPDVAVLLEYLEFAGQIDPTTGQTMPTRKIHIQYVLSKEDGKWLIQSELIMDEEHYAKDK
jgi:uncharacterized protein (TIGR02246 family)